MTEHRILSEVRACCERALIAVAGTPEEELVSAIRSRLDEPLRVAIAGRVKAGKSTLLNALIGERLAPTDAGECTRVVSWYREAMGYEVTAERGDGTRVELRFTRDGGPLDIDLAGMAFADIDHLDIGWPSSALRATTLIDTPGLASLDERTSIRTEAMLGDDSPGAADAVIYLMRHLHRLDADFLETFAEDDLTRASPTNAIAVLSRADEVGAGRVDAMESAERVAQRYRGDPALSRLCLTVLPVAGLVGEAASTLEEREFAVLRELADLPLDTLNSMVLSADRFCALDAATSVAPELRRDLLGRVGMFGLRYSLRALRTGEAADAVGLAAVLLSVSGLPALQTVLRGHFLGRAQLLKARTAMAALRAMAREMAATDPAGAAALDADLERVESSAHEFAELRLLHLIATDLVRLDDDQKAEVARVVHGLTPAEKAGCPADSSTDELRARVLEAAGRWRARLDSPVLDPSGREAYEIIARSYEGLYLSLSS